MAHTPSTRFPNGSGRSEACSLSLWLAGGINSAMRLSHTTSLAWRAKRLLWVFAAMLLVTAGPKEVMAGPTVVFDGNVQNHCQTGDCCWKFTITLNQEICYGGFLYIQLLTGTPSLTDSCIDQSCWTGQGYPTCSTCPYEMKHNDEFGGPNEYDIEFLTCEPAGYTFDVYICGSNSCLQQFPYYNWYGYDGMGDPGWDTLRQPLTACTGSVLNGCAYGCSWISGNANVGHGNECWASFCFQSDDLTGPLCSFTLNFNPPLNDCQLKGRNPTNGDKPKCYNSDHEVDNGIFDLPTDWIAINDPVTGNLTIECDPAHSPAACIFGACQGFCFSIPDCGDTTRIVTVVSPDPCTNTVTVPLKWATHEVMPLTDQEYQQNYPNPLDAATGFKTTIPFSTADKGTAYLRIVDSKGSVVVLDNQSVAYAGQHFFYLTGDSLSAGTYYYQIEFPKGVPIENNKMLVVR